MKKIVLTGGGTAGHVYPALAVKEELGGDYQFHFIGGEGMEKDIVAKEKGIVYHQIHPVKLERKLTLKNLLIPLKLIKSIFEAKKNLKEMRPDIIFSKGGFVAVPVVIAGHWLKIPVISHESDLSMGLANKIILKYCLVMCTTFKQTCDLSPKCIYTGQPIRKKILNGNKNNIKNGNFDKNKRNLLIVGGSSGAKFLNDITADNLEKITKKFNVIHLTGKNALAGVSYQNYLPLAYAENMGDYLDWADIVLSRAGSGAINEFLAKNLPMLLIPLSKKCSRGDQIENAKLFSSLGIAKMIEEEEFSNEKLLDCLDDIVKHQEKYIKNMKNISSNNASKKIAKIIKENLK